MNDILLFGDSYRGKLHQTALTSGKLRHPRTLVEESSREISGYTPIIPDILQIDFVISTYRYNEDIFLIGVNGPMPKKDSIEVAINSERPQPIQL